MAGQLTILTQPQCTRIRGGLLRAGETVPDPMRLNVEILATLVRFWLRHSKGHVRTGLQRQALCQCNLFVTRPPAFYSPRRMRLCMAGHEPGQAAVTQLSDEWVMQCLEYLLSAVSPERLGNSVRAYHACNAMHFLSFRARKTYPTGSTERSEGCWAVSGPVALFRKVRAGERDFE